MQIYLKLKIKDKKITRQKKFSKKKLTNLDIIKKLTNKFKIKY